MRILRNGVAALVCLAVSGGIGACGDDDSDKTTAAPATTQAEPATTTAPVTETTREQTASGDGAATTEPGTELKLGETAHVMIKPLTAASGSAKTYPLDVTVLKIEKGSIDDLKNINLQPAQKTSTPYYVAVRVASTAGTVPVKMDDPDIRFDGIDDRGQEQGSVTFIGNFERCDDKAAPDPFMKGESYESCLAYLVPKGASIREVRWTGTDKYIIKPVTWR